MRSTYYLLFFVFSINFHSSLGFWRLACSVAQTARIDPVLDPGETSGHVHKLCGASNINQDSTYDTLQTTNCSTCEVQADHSAYWTPQLYYYHSNGTVQEVRNVGMTVYYVGRGGNTSNTVPFPPGFKMLSGNSTLRSYDNETLTYLNTRPIADRVSFHCIDAANDIPEQHYMFDTNCVNGMRAQINFQSCWDGVNLYLEDQSHVAYLSGIDYGVCPPTHPVSIPGLFFEVLYFTNEIDQSAGGTFTFAQGDATGYGFHGDFLNGWDMDVQTAAVQNCLYETASQGVVSACPYLAPTDDTNVPRDCLPSPPLNDEPVLGFLNQLPGCNNVTFGPEPAPQILCPLDSNIPESTQMVTSSATPYSPQTSTVSLNYVTVTVADATDTAVLTVATESTATSFTTGYESTGSTLSTFSTDSAPATVETSSFNGYSFTTSYVATVSVTTGSFVSESFTSETFTTNPFTTAFSTTESFTTDYSTVDSSTVDSSVIYSFTSDSLSTDSFTTDYITTDSFTVASFTSTSFDSVVTLTTSSEVFITSSLTIADPPVVTTDPSSTIIDPAAADSDPSTTFVDPETTTTAGTDSSDISVYTFSNLFTTTITSSTASGGIFVDEPSSTDPPALTTDDSDSIVYVTVTPTDFTDLSTGTTTAIESLITTLVTLTLPMPPTNVTTASPFYFNTTASGYNFTIPANTTSYSIPTEYRAIRGRAWPRRKFVM